jgi:hypothetical protein
MALAPRRLDFDPALRGVFREPLAVNRYRLSNACLPGARHAGGALSIRHDMSF